MTDVKTRFKPVRIRSRRHLDRLKTLPCAGCGRTGIIIDPHHIKIGPQGGGSVVAGDEWAVPLGRWCCHLAAAIDGVHAGGEAAWWARKGKDGVAIARHHAEISRGLGLLPKET